MFVDHPMFLEKVWGKTGSKIYGPNAGVDYKDNQLRFSLLCQVEIVQCLTVVYDFITVMSLFSLFAGCSGSTQGSEFKYQQIFLRTIWYGGLSPSVSFSTLV